MTPTKHPPQTDKLHDWQGLYDELNQETSDRALVIVGFEFLSQHLAKLIEAFLIDAKETRQLLVPFQDDFDIIG